MLTGTADLMPTQSPRTGLSGCWSTVEPLAECRAALHRRPFRITHELASHPLFTVDALIRVAQDAAKRRGDVYFDAGDVGIDDKWGHIPVPDMPVDEVLRRIEHAGAWIALKHVNADPAYAEVLREYVGFMHNLAGENAHLLRNPEIVVFIASPGRFTPFHFDAEVNVLAQVHGRKSLWVCDPQDRCVVSETDIENYYGVSISAGRYTSYADTVATRYDLAPGDALHIPTHGAHWVRNFDEVSVSLSFNFELPRWANRDIFLANYYLRRLGLAPRPPGKSRLSDGMKVVAIEAARWAKGVARRRPAI